MANWARLVGLNPWLGLLGIHYGGGGGRGGAGGVVSYLVFSPIDVRGENKGDSIFWVIVIMIVIVIVIILEIS